MIDFIEFIGKILIKVVFVDGKIEDNGRGKEEGKKWRERRKVRRMFIERL